MRLAILDRDICQPTDCSSSKNKPCIKYCPRVRTGDETIVLGKDGFPYLNPILCSGCGICVKKCPFHCYKIINIPEKLESQVTHKYVADGFSLFRMLIPRVGRVLGVIGQNGIGKSTALKILSGDLKMNLGLFSDEKPDWDQIIDNFKGSELHAYLTNLKDKKLKIIHKPQEITQIPKFVKGNVKDLLTKLDDSDLYDDIIKKLSLEKILNRDLDVLSGGELQKVSIAAILLRKGDCYLIDEPSSYLDVKERLNMANLIRALPGTDKRVIVVEHDLAILDYLSDNICLLYGEPGGYGIISHPQGVRVGINIYLNGYIKDENMRFREQAIRFHERPPNDSLYGSSNILFEFNDMEKTLGDFKLKVSGGEIHAGEVIGILGPNGIGKTTFINLIAGKIKPDKGEINKELKVSLKPQYIDYDKDLYVSEIIGKMKSSPFDSQYLKRLFKSFKLDIFGDRKISELSGGELQRLAISDCLTTEADVYLLDEPSAFLDVEMRLNMAMVTRKSIESIKKSAFIVEHDIITQDFISDSLIVFKGEGGVSGYAGTPQDLRSGMNEFLQEMNITFRRDLSTGRPRVNKFDSNLDKYQRKIGEYYYIPSKNED
jgi:ATP-binding cassette, sub-family E, member 1